MADPDAWAAFPDAQHGGADPWAGFKDAAPATSGEHRTPAATPSLGNDSIIGAPVDGDTLALSSGRHLRLYGVDAPETRQQGWDRAGNPVPIGTQTTSALGKRLAEAVSIIGAPVGESYGRPVAPVTVNGADLGHDLARSGNALAAPVYMSADPARRFDYMQAERLARLNRLGMHNTFAQTPADFRHNPQPAPDRETIAAFWDTPTPYAGMRPEVEAQFYSMLNDPHVSASAVSQYAHDNGGFVVSPAEVSSKRALAHRAGKTIGVNYTPKPKILTDQGDGMSGAIARGLGDGVLPNFLDEAGAVVDTLGGTQNRENIWNSDRRLADIWANNQQQNEAITGFDELAHPYARLGGELAGGLPLPMGKVTSAADLAKFGAGYGFASGFGRGDGLSDRLASGVIGAGEGAALTVVGGKLLEAAAPAVGRAWSKVTGRERALTTLAPENASTGLPDGVPPPPEGFTVVPHEAAGTPAAVPMAGEPGAAIAAELPRPVVGQAQRLDQPLSEAQLNARAADVQPGDVLPIPSNVVGSPEEAAAIDKGRIVPAAVPHESSELTRRTVTGWNGEPVTKVGPTDLVGWLRLNGGLRDQGGELAHMGLNNAARRGMDHVGQEARFGPLVHDAGMNFDDASLKAWEAGYFPDSVDRPDINTFLNTVRGTHEGWNRAFHPDDFAELDRFNAARDDRTALLAEQGNNDGNPIYRDTSVAAGADAPFPPVSAYEEWPAGGPDFAGNINLGKLDSPQDIKRALDTTQRQVGGFDAATRGRVTHAETEALAADLGVTPATLIARRKGQAFNAEEALAARQILAKSGNELVNTARRVSRMEQASDEELAAFRQAWLRHVAIQEQVAGATAEAGRALQQFRMTADSRAVPKDVLASAVADGPGGRKRLQDAADALLDAVEMEPGKFNVLAEKLNKPRWIDKATELRYFMLLSGPQTHAANIISNTLTALGQLPEHAVAAGIGAGRRMVQGHDAAMDRVYGTELGQRAFGLVQGFKDGMRQFGRTIRTGETSDHYGKIEGPQSGAIGGLAGAIVRTPMRALAAEDEVFKAMARRMELNGLAARTAAQEGLSGKAAVDRIAAIVSNPSDEMLAKAFDYARYLTFQRPLTGMAQSISGLVQKHPVAKFIIPFVRTPANLLRFAAERSPAAPLLKEWRADMAAGGARRDLAIAKSTVGTAIGIYVADLARSGLITGSAPDDQNKANLKRADGWQPYSIKVGDRYVSYNRLDPFAVTLGTAADMATKQDGMTDRQLEQSTSLLVGSIIKSMGERTWLSGLSDFMGAMHDAQRNGPGYIKQQVASMVVPAGVAQVARTIDPTKRLTHGVGEEIQARIPVSSKGLFPQRDIWGQQVVNDRLGPDSLSPITATTARHDLLNAAMLNLGAIATRFPKQHTVAGNRVDYTPAEYDRLSAAAGAGAHDRISSLIRAPGWAARTPEAQRAAVAKAIKGERSAARAGGSTPATDRWSAFPDAAGHAKPDKWAAFKSVEQPDVAGELQQFIPGLTVTSGYRTREYQDDMRRRGYKPADDSHHLDGSSLDIVPPRGMSLQTLGGLVRSRQQNAVLYPEGDHLHVTFPGWFGAPVAGGARAWGFANPNAAKPEGMSQRGR